MPSQNLKSLRAAHENWNRRDFDALVSAMREDVSYTDHPRGLILNTKNEFKSWAVSWGKAFPNGKILSPHYLDAGDTVVAQFIGEGTNNGPFGNFPATGRRMMLAFCEIWQFDGTGRFSSGQVYYDQYTLFSQLGIVPLRAAAV